MEKIVLFPIELSELLESIRTIVREEIYAKESKEFGEKLLSPSEACKTFSPAISKPTLKYWTEQGLITEHRIGGRVYYKQAELLESAKSVKRYTRAK